MLWFDNFMHFSTFPFTTQISNNLWTGHSPGSSVVSSCMIPRGSPPCVTSPYPHSPRAGEHGYVGFPNHQQNQFGVSLNNFFADSLLAPSANSHAAFETKPEFERRSSSIAVLRMKAKEHAANISWAMWTLNFWCEQFLPNNNTASYFIFFIGTTKISECYSVLSKII